jgi:hypothetical protein
MNPRKTILKFCRQLALAMLTLVLFSCHGLEELNENPNQLDAESVDPNLLISTVINNTGKTIVGLGFGDIAGVMQHTQKDGWSGGHNAYDWTSESYNWSGYYQTLKNNQTMLEKAETENLDFHTGAGLVLKSYLFGMIADLYGDAPYSGALKGDQGTEFFDAPFDAQRDIYLGIFSDLERANTLLSGDSYLNVEGDQDILYGGDAGKWRKLANSLALRYYMRLSEKEPQLAQQGIAKIVGNPGTYPLILSMEDDANMGYIGNSSADAWPTNTVFDEDPQGAYMRIKMGKTLVDIMQDLNDPRLGVWANGVAVPLAVEAGVADDFDEVDEDGVRRVSQAIVDNYEATYGYPVDFDPDFVGYPTGMTLGAVYNLSKDPNQGTFNEHASQLNEIYREASGDLLQARFMSATEVNFILAEAAFKGWIGGSSETYYNMAIQQSLNAWGVGSAYESYITGPAAYGDYEDIIIQKWIGSWTAATEAWFDYRRTGIPDLQTGPTAKRTVLPIRFYYNENEVENNTTNVEAAINNLETTEFNGTDPQNSAWSKIWLLQGTNEPY